ncbi:MAG TPA: bifunctional riboflavin kinase/FAD synthetase [Candidatus Limnocylindrales bacterium]|nr:bifunctional riboflavin kinase/FAD synthetase [Candidatus Limnocylindrales bacterium]
MQVLEHVDALPAGLRYVIAVGMFDGVHRGHQQVLRTTVEAARAEGAMPVVLTFNPHPAAVLRGAAPPLLCDPSEKISRLARAGIGLTVVCPFDHRFAEQSPEAFLRRLADRRELRGVVMSAESAFGRDRAGTIAAVESLAPELGFRVVQAPERHLAGSRISSSRIRDALAAGRLADVRRLMGRDYAVIGTVVHGDARGRELGYPTANLDFDEPVALPPDGIYAARVSWGGPDPLDPDHDALGVCSLGVRPTFGVSGRTLEVHLFDFDGDLYDRRLRMAFVRRQRGERRFASVRALVEQMDRDSERARAILGPTASAATQQPRRARESRTRVRLRPVQER